MARDETMRSEFLRAQDARERMFASIVFRPVDTVRQRICARSVARRRGAASLASRHPMSPDRLFQPIGSVR
jgi:hypothetical protein